MPSRAARSASVCPFVGPPTKKHAKNRCASRDNLSQWQVLRIVAGHLGPWYCTAPFIVVDERIWQDVSIQVRHGPRAPARHPGHPSARRPRTSSRQYGERSDRIARSYWSHQRSTHLNPAPHASPRPPPCTGNSAPLSADVGALSAAHTDTRRVHPPNRAQSPSTAVASYH